jgi:hypothetical protein
MVRSLGMKFHIFHSLSFVQVCTWSSKKVSVILILLIARTLRSALTNCSSVLINTAQSSAGDWAMSSCCGGYSSKSSSSPLSSTLSTSSTAASSNCRGDVQATAAGFRLTSSGVHCMSQHMFQLLLLVSLHAWTTSYCV